MHAKSGPHPATDHPRDHNYLYRHDFRHSHITCSAQHPFAKRHISPNRTRKKLQFLAKLGAIHRLAVLTSAAFEVGPVVHIVLGSRLRYVDGTFKQSQLAE